MKFMLTWRTRPGLYKAAFKQFLETGGPPPKGVEQVARYQCPARFWAGTSWKRTT